MKHAEISFNTKKRLSNALKKKMRTKPLSKITINELIASCDVNRNTFYYHFKDIYELLKWTLEQDALDVVASMDLLENTEAAIRFILNYIDKNKYIIACTYDSLGRDQLKNFLYTDIRSIVDKNLEEIEKASKLPLSGKEMEYVSMFFTEGIAGALINYLKNPNYYTHDEIVSLNMQLLNRLRLFLGM